MKSTIFIGIGLNLQIEAKAPRRQLEGERGTQAGSGVLRRRGDAKAERSQGDFPQVLLLPLQGMNSDDI